MQRIWWLNLVRGVVALLIGLFILVDALAPWSKWFIGAWMFLGGILLMLQALHIRKIRITSEAAPGIDIPLAPFPCIPVL